MMTIEMYVFFSKNKHYHFYRSNYHTEDFALSDFLDSPWSLVSPLLPPVRDVNHYVPGMFVHVNYRVFFFFVFFFFLHPIDNPRPTLPLPPSSKSDPRSHTRPYSPLPTTTRAFVFITRIIQLFVPSSTRVELLN
ncbi:unnamed protein product [Laminaria digitata]